MEQYFKGYNHKKLQGVLLSLFALAYIILFGTRGINVGVDTENSSSYFLGERVFESLAELKDIGIYIISMFVRLFSKDINAFLTVLASLYVIPIVISIRRITTNNRLILFFILVSFFFFKSMGINTVRQGIAASFFLLGLTYYLEKKYIPTIVLYFIAFINHASIAVLIGISLISKLLKTPKIPIYIFAIAAVLSFFNVGVYNILVKIPIVNILVEDRLTGYVQGIEGIAYRTGFRLDFFVFNTIFAYIGYLTLSDKNTMSFNRSQYLSIYISYLLASSVFFLMFTAAYSDRFGFLSWLLIPLLLMPYIQNKQSYGMLSTASICVLCFAIFITFNFVI